MNEFMFHNFMDTRVLRRSTQRGIKSIVPCADFSDSVGLASVFETVSKENGKVLEISVDGNSEVDLIGNFACERVGFTEEQLHHTNSNPLIMVATKSVHFFEGVPTYVKYITLKGGVLITLISGILEVEATDGTYVQLSRCCAIEGTMDFYKHTSEDFEKGNPLKDTETNVPFVNNVVNDCVITISSSKDGRVDTKYSFNRDYFVRLDTSVFEEGKAKLEKELASQEGLHASREKERQAFEELQRAKYAEQEAKDDEKKRKQLIKMTNARNKAMGIKPVRATKPEESVTGASGAAAFMDFVASVKRPVKG